MAFISINLIEEDKLRPIPLRCPSLIIKHLISFWNSCNEHLLKSEQDDSDKGAKNRSINYSTNKYIYGRSKWRNGNRSP